MTEPEAWVPLHWTIAAVWVTTAGLMFAWWLWEVRRSHFPRRGPRRRRRRRNTPDARP